MVHRLDQKVIELRLSNTPLSPQWNLQGYWGGDNSWIFSRKHNSSQISVQISYYNIFAGLECSRQYRSMTNFVDKIVPEKLYLKLTWRKNKLASIFDHLMLKQESGIENISEDFNLLYWIFSLYISSNFITITLWQYNILLYILEQYMKVQFDEIC